MYLSSIIEGHDIIVAITVHIIDFCLENRSTKSYLCTQIFSYKVFFFIIKKSRFSVLCHKKDIVIAIFREISGFNQTTRSSISCKSKVSLFYKSSFYRSVFKKLQVPCFFYCNNIWSIVIIVVKGLKSYDIALFLKKFSYTGIKRFFLCTSSKFKIYFFE